MNRALIAMLLLVIVCFAGCGPKGKGLKVEYVEGIVTLDGTTIEGAFVTFSATGEGEGATGVSGPGGVYKLTSLNGDIDKGAIAGNYKVTVRKVESTNYLNEDGSFMPNAPIDPATGGRLGTVQKDLLPMKYSMLSSTDLNVTVAPGKNNINLELTSN